MWDSGVTRRYVMFIKYLFYWKNSQYQFVTVVNLGTRECQCCYIVSVRWSAIFKKWTYTNYVDKILKILTPLYPLRGQVHYIQGHAAKVAKSLYGAYGIYFGPEHIFQMFYIRNNWKKLHFIDFAENNQFWKFFKS